MGAGIREMSIHFRDATPSEREWAATVMASSDPWLRLGRTIEACRAVLGNPRVEVTVAVSDGTPSGFAIVDRQGFAGAPYLKIIAVDGKGRGSGVGSALLERIEETYGRPARNLFLCVSSFNTRAQALYERRGFVRIGQIDDYLVDGEHEILMRKRFPR